MAEVISLFRNELGYSHAICSPCGGNTFHIETVEDEAGIHYYSHLVCRKCGNRIPLNIKAVWGPKSKGGENGNRH